MSSIGMNGVDLVAVVGLSCRLPGAADPAAFWGMLREGSEAIGPLGDKLLHGELLRNGIPTHFNNNDFMEARTMIFNV